MSFQEQRVTDLEKEGNKARKALLLHQKEEAILLISTINACDYNDLIVYILPTIAIPSSFLQLSFL